MRRRGGTRRVAIIAALTVALAAVAAACGNPKQSVQHCIGAPDEAISAIQGKIEPDAKAKLRNGKMVHLKGADYTFVSAELHLDDDAPHDKGEIGTWATTDIKSSDGFLSVDVHAREDSTWPHAPFKVTEDGAIESRACTSLNTGKTRAQLECEQQQSSGENVVLPEGKDCSDL